MTELLSSIPGPQQKSFLDCDKENQEAFTDADFTNSVLPENGKPLRLNDAFKSRQTEGSVQLAEKLAAFKKQKRESLMPSTRARKNLQPLDANTKDFSTSHKPSSAAPSLTPLSLKPLHSTILPFNAAVLVPPIEPKIRVSEGNKKVLLPSDSNELKLAKERILQREQNQNDREAKLNKKAQELRAKESKLETEQALLEKKQKNQLDLLRQEREIFIQEKATYQAKLDRCDHIDEEMAKSEAAVRVREEMACVEANAIVKKKEEELALVFKEREMNFNIEIDKKKAEIESYLLICKQEIERKEAKLLLDQEAFEKERETVQKCLEQQQRQAQSLQLREMALLDDRTKNESRRNENEKWQQSLSQKEQELLIQAEKLEHITRDQSTKEVELRQRLIDCEEQENKARDIITASQRAEKRLTLAEDTLLQKQKAFKLAQEEHVAEVLDWQSAKECLIFENEQLKRQQLSVAEAEGRLETSKRNLQSEKQKLALEWQEYQNCKAEQRNKELQQHATQERIEAALSELKNKETTIGAKTENLLLEQAASTKRSEELRIQQLDFEQRSCDLKEKEAVVESSLVSALEMDEKNLRMKEQNLCEQAKINALWAQINQERNANGEERARVQQFQKLLLAEEDNLLEKEQRIKEREEEMEDLLCKMEDRAADLARREAAIEARTQEINVRFSRMQQFEAVFDT